MIPRIYLSVVGLLYLILSVWCSIDPATTSGKVGFSLKGGSGQSEFLAIYGGLELALALMFFAPWWKQEYTEPMMLACLLLHLCLVVYRTFGFFLFSEFESMTYRLAAGEWLILISSIVVWWFYTGE